MKLPKAYNPSHYESDIYELWEKSGAFFADPKSDKEHFSIAMPPPNETGTLSLGHALFLTLQDIMARHERQKGKDVLWLPGTDHAALAVNAIIEKKLAEEGTNKHEVGREAFLAKTREFVSGSRETMLNQMRAMGASADWSRLRYTLDDALSRMVVETFIKMHGAGLIYRGHRIVNWDPNLETNVSDDEIQYIEEKSTFYTFQYGPFQISTARPETKFGDKYVVMHPDDKRYKKYNHGDTFECEWINGKITATIIKDEAIDRTFGTGVMTITPWHDHTDFEIAERHGLLKEQIIDLKGNMLPIAGEYAGMPIEKARGLVVEKLRKKGLVVKEEEYTHNVAINERGKGKIEPQIRLQWFVDVNKPAVDWKGKKLTLKEVMKDVITSGDIKITPKRFEKTYFQWIDNLRDWCITRQIWWGHRVPVWYRAHTDGREETYVGHEAPTDDSEGWNEWEQDPDTLDTWFSSALWTWSTLVDKQKAADYSLSLEDVLKQSPDYQAYHPTSVLETGWDILFFWVARMILSTTFVTGQIPFKNVYLHGMVRAEDGKKMSKSRPESIIDPLAVIPKYGTDALRMALIWGTSPGTDFNWSTPKIEATRNFCNKLWNIARYIEDKTDGQKIENIPKPESLADHWVLLMLQRSSELIGSHLDNFRFSEAYDELYHFVWDDVADWYIEASKSDLNPSVLVYVLEGILKLAHPFAPFVTEAIWQTFHADDNSLLMAELMPVKTEADSKKAEDFEHLKNIISEIRFIQHAMGIGKTPLIHKSEDLVSENSELIKKLSKSGDISEGKGSGIRLTSTKHAVWLDIDDKKLEDYLAKLENDRLVAKESVDRLEARLNNKGYAQNAPKNIVDQTKQQLEEEKQLLKKIEEEIKRYA